MFVDECQLERNNIIPGYFEIITNITNSQENMITRFILIGKEEAFVFYTDTEEKELFGHYKIDL